jgi:hypothetical protein
MMEAIAAGLGLFAAMTIAALFLIWLRRQGGKEETPPTPEPGTVAAALVDLRTAFVELGENMAKELEPPMRRLKEWLGQRDLR